MALNSIFTGRIKHIHLVGIGGIGMSGIARVLLGSGFQVSGSDLHENRELQALRGLGAKIALGHDKSHVTDADVLVYSSAVQSDNPELAAARQKNIPIIPRAVMLAELMRLRCGIAIAGAHGKTTTTSLIGTMMHMLGFDPTIIIGGIVNHFGANAVIGQGQFMVAEADESDGTFLHLSPTIAVVTNIDAEHLDFYRGGIEEIRANFRDFLHTVPFYGLVVACSDDANVREVLHDLNRRVVTYGLQQGAMFRAQNIITDNFTTFFEVVVKETHTYPIRINMVGTHNVLNTLATIAVLDELGSAPNVVAPHLPLFNGVKRRFSVIPSPEPFLIIDDYAHHPTEIRAVLKAAKESFKNRKIHVLFQPHRYSRTKDLLDEFAHSFVDCDSLILTDIYSAQEHPIEGITSALLMKKIQNSCTTPITHVSSLEEGINTMALRAQTNDILMTLGAGSVTQAGPLIAQLLAKKPGIAHD